MWGRRSCLLPVWALCVLCMNWLVGLSTAENCTDGYDDVYSLAMKHWAKNNYEVKNQPISESRRPTYDGTCRRCQSCRVKAQYREEIVNGSRLLVSNGMPNHVYQVYSDGRKQNPNEACSQPVYMVLNKPTKGTKFVSSGLGPVGFAVTGAFLFNHLSNPSGEDDVAAVIEDNSFDTCMGHAAPGCVYHYHRAPKSGCIPKWNDCVLVGWLRDGFPVYSFCRKKKTGGEFLKTCYELKRGDGSSTSHYDFNEDRFKSGNCDLDQANGYTFPADVWGNEWGIDNYGYVFSEGYPFIMPGYFGSELHPVITLAGSAMSTSFVLTALCVLAGWLLASGMD